MLRGNKGNQFNLYNCYCLFIGGYIILESHKVFWSTSIPGMERWRWERKKHFRPEH